MRWFVALVAAAATILPVGGTSQANNHSETDKNSCQWIHGWAPADDDGGNSSWALLGPNNIRDQFGQRVALSGNGQVLAVGAPGFNHPHTGSFGWTSDAGLVRTYRVSTGDHNDNTTTSTSSVVLTQMGQDLPGQDRNDYLGLALALNYEGTRLAAGAPGGFRGFVDIYDWNGARWELNQRLKTDTPIGLRLWFGLAIGLSSDGERLAISEPRYGRDELDREAEHPGAVRVYQHALNGTSHVWTQIGQQLNGTGVRIEFGRFLSLSGDGQWLVVGSSEESFILFGRNDDAYAQLYRYNDISDIWDAVGEPLAYEPLMTDLTMVDHQTIVIATSNGALARGTAYIRILRLAGDQDKFEQIGNTLSLTEYRYSRFAIDLSNDARTLVVGHNYGRQNDGENDDESVQNPPGHVEMYRLEGGERALTGYFEGDNPNDSYGVSATMSHDGRLVAAGALGNGQLPERAGYVHVYIGDPKSCSESKAALNQTNAPTVHPPAAPSESGTSLPSTKPSTALTTSDSTSPSAAPSTAPNTQSPNILPSIAPTNKSVSPSTVPSAAPSDTQSPSIEPSIDPSDAKQNPETRNSPPSSNHALFVCWSACFTFTCSALIALH